ncbi:MAG: TetR/AcrR family transcriptional regulator [Kiritimatiellae bacterium]|nr:TetR/AcrR family transcriptional regulator [Kiritimatiellia bacterium]
MRERNQSSAAELIAAAFMELMLEKPYMEITVTDIITRAGVARASFYRNYNSTSDILEHAIDRVVADFSETVLPIMAGNDERAWRDLLFRYIYQFCEQHRRLASSRPDNIPILFTIMNGRIRELESQRAASTIEEKYRITARVGAISNILRIWMDDGMKESPEEIVNYIMGFITLI